MAAAPVAISLILLRREPAAQVQEVLPQRCIVGRGGERYERVWNAVPKPDVSVRKAGSKRGSKGETMDLVLDQQVITDTGDWAVAWFPRDLEVSNKAGEDAEVQLVEKKNKLFGKIESVWK